MTEVTKKDVFKHYISSVVVYGTVLLLAVLCPLFNQTVENPYFNYITVLGVYYAGYVLLAFPVLNKLRPQSILQSRNAAILNYFKRQFEKNLPVKIRLENIEPDENEKQSFVILFIKSFFGIYFLSLLCNKFIPSLFYNLEFIKGLFNLSFETGFLQFIDDTADVWLTLMFTVTSFVFALSYLTETKFLKNNIKYADTTPLGIISCIICYYPLIMITNKLMPFNSAEIVSVENRVLRLALYCLILIVNLVSMFAVLRLGTKSSNLTNRGIVTGFPYNIVRHPDYSMQMFYVVLTSLPFYFMDNIPLIGKILGTLGIILWIFIYYLRSITEERNLIKDEDYQKYCEKIRYRFIPKLF